jgi:hypothetical protein
MARGSGRHTDAEPWQGSVPSNVPAPGARRATLRGRGACSRRPPTPATGRSRAPERSSAHGGAGFFAPGPPRVTCAAAGVADRGRCGRVVRGNALAPLQPRAGPDAEPRPARGHGDAVTRPEHGQCVRPQGAPPWGGTRTLSAAAPPEPARFARGFPGLDLVPMRAVRPGGQAFPLIMLVTTNTIEKPISLS